MVVVVVVGGGGGGGGDRFLHNNLSKYVCYLHVR